MPLLTLQDACLSFGDQPLLENANFLIDNQERVCITGRNGAGKSTLLKVLSGELSLDEGRILRHSDLIISRLQQDPPRDAQGTVYDFVAEGIQNQAEYLKAWHALSRKMQNEPNEKHLDEMARLQEKLDHHNVWQLEANIHTVLQHIGLSADVNLSSLSGGWLRKAALAQALVCQPQLLLLDEPTNHLDIESIRWLEAFLKNFKGSLIFISHDRAFIQAIATRIVDVDRGKLTSWPGDYQKYLTGKAEALRVEEMQNAEFDRKLAQEEVWIRQGIKARRTRNEGRVRALEALRRERGDRREVMGRAQMNVDTAARSGKRVFELENVSYRVGNKTLIHHFSTQVLRGDKIALVGPNGCGKTTLLKLLLGDIQPSEGIVTQGTKLDIAFFDQHRATLDPTLTVLENLADGKQEITINGKTRHALGYLQDFLFHPKRARTPVSALSGGEKNRLLLARLFAKPSNLLILDEPTNDLDVETLELLEERVTAYQGTVLLVSHDRQFIDNTVTETWLFEENGEIGVYPGGYHDAQQQRAGRRPMGKSSEKSANNALEKERKERKNPIISPNLRKLSYNEQRELERLPQMLEKFDKELQALQGQIADSNFYQQPYERTQSVFDALAQTEKAIEETFARWEYLESLKNKT